MGVRIREEKERDIELFLEQVGEEINLCAIGKDGEKYSILWIDQDGTFSRFDNISSDSGIQVDSYGKIVEV